MGKETMGRRKGSLNKKIENVQLNFNVNTKDFNEKTEVCMTTEVANELEVIQQELDQARIELENTKFAIEENKIKLKNMPIPVPVAETPAVINKNAAAAALLEDQKARDSVEVTGRFINRRVKGQSVKLPYLKYGHEPVKWWPFDDNKVYTIPKGFADQINGGTETDPCYYTPHFIKNEGIILNPDEPESGIHGVDTTDKKYAFIPLNF